MLGYPARNTGQESITRYGFYLLAEVEVWYTICVY